MIKFSVYPSARRWSALVHWSVVSAGFPRRKSLSIAVTSCFTSPGSLSSSLDEGVALRVGKCTEYQSVTSSEGFHRVMLLASVVGSLM